MRLLICAGGTGGGVYPALTVLQALGHDADPTLWVGGINGMEVELIQRQNIPFTGIPAAGVHGVGLRTLPGNVLQLTRGLAASRKILHDFRPDVLLFTGGYVAVPMAMMATGYKSLLYVPDIEPGLALKTLARFSDRIALTTDESKKYFSNQKKTVVSGYPTRPDLSKWTQAQGRQALGLNEGTPVVLVLGGSKGARSINRAISKDLPSLLQRVQVVHISGQLDWEEIQAVRASLPANLADRYHPFPYLHEEMGAALAAADLAVCRAGASTLGELPLFGLPAILVPYPYAWRYQKVNAEYLVERGAARLLVDQDLSQKLTGSILELIDDPKNLSTMSAAMSALSRPHAAEEIAALLRDLAGSSSAKVRLSA